MRRCVFYVRLLSLLLSFLRCCFSPFTTAKTSPRYFQVDFLQTRGCTFKAVTLQRLETFRSVLFRFVSFRFISFCLGLFSFVLLFVFCCPPSRHRVRQGAGGRDG